MITVKKSTIFNTFILIWFSIGSILFTYGLLLSLFNGDFFEFTFRYKLKIIIPWLIFTLYVIAYIRYKREQKSSNH